MRKLLTQRDSRVLLEKVKVKYAGSGSGKIVGVTIRQRKWRPTRLRRREASKVIKGRLGQVIREEPGEKYLV
ncbi:hypothetical protein ACFX2I_005347 [Malus domestica]